MDDESSVSKVTWCGEDRPWRVYDQRLRKPTVFVEKVKETRFLVEVSLHFFKKNFMTGSWVRAACAE